MKLNYKIKYLESTQFQSGGGKDEQNTTVVKVISPDESYIQILQKNQEPLEQIPPQNNVEEDLNQNKIYNETLSNNSVKLDIPNIPLGTTTERTDGNFYYKGVWAIKLGYQ